MGDEVAHWEGVGQIQPQGGPQADREATSEREGRSVGIPPVGGRDGGSGTEGGEYLSLSYPEHGCTVHYNQAHYGPVSGGAADTRAKGIQSVVVIGRDGCGRDVGSRLGGGTDGGGGGDGRDGEGINW